MAIPVAGNTTPQAPRRSGERRWSVLSLAALLTACQALPIASQPLVMPTASSAAAASPANVIATKTGVINVPVPASTAGDPDAVFQTAADPVAETVTVTATSSAKTGFRAPAPGGVAFSAPMVFDYRYKAKGSLGGHVQIQLDHTDITARFHAGPLADQWIATVDDLAPGHHTLTETELPKGLTVTTGFDYLTGKPLDRIVALADATVLRLPANSLNWDWGPGLLMYALARLDAHTGGNRYQPYLQAYYAHHLQQGIPTIDWSDKCSPALGALELYKRTNDPAYRAIGEKVATYLHTMKPTRDGGLNHFGTYLFSHIYPQSMWVDSLMMYDVFAARWGTAMGDSSLQAFAAEQPLDFAKVLQNSNSQLWKHAWLTTLRRPVPSTETYWLRGNGWAMVSFPEVLDVLPSDTPQRAEMVSRYQAQAQALLPYQGELGLWTTVLNKPNVAYLETSGTALCAYGMMHGAHAGYLPTAFAAPGAKAYLGVLDRLQNQSLGLSMPEISHNTMPYPEIGYTLIPEVNDMPYGLAALILAGIAYDESETR